MVWSNGCRYVCYEGLTWDGREKAAILVGHQSQSYYETWIRYLHCAFLNGRGYPHIQFEYISAHEMLYTDMANAAKQVGNVSAGPWWHYFRRHKIARMIRDQLSMGPLRAIACGFTDARFVEMIVAEYRSVRLAVADALAHLVADRYSMLYHDFDAAENVMKELLFDNPAAVHSIPIGQ